MIVGYVEMEQPVKNTKKERGNGERAKEIIFQVNEEDANWRIRKNFIEIVITRETKQNHYGSSPRVWKMKC